MSNNGVGTAIPHAAAGVTFASAREGAAVLPDIQDEPSFISSQASKGKRNDTSGIAGEHRDGAVREPQMNGDLGESRVKHAQRTKKSGGFLLDPLISPHKSRGHTDAQSTSARSEQHMYNNADKRKSTGSRFSGESSHRSSPLSREILQNESSSIPPPPRRGVQMQTLDPTQLVQMALSLSESRKRHFSGSKIPGPIAVPAGVRNVSGSHSGYGTVRSRPSSAQHSAHLSEGVPGQSTPLSYAGHATVESTDGSIATASDSEHYDFSPATLSRAEKARKYFELASEHRRLLDHLPPLRDESSVPRFLNGGTAEGKKRMTGTEDSRKPGREYNPLQALRNRRLRNKDGRVLPAPPEAWHDLETVRAWVDDVAVDSWDSSTTFGREKTHLPRYSGELENNHQSRPQTSKGHRRTDTVGSVITRPENGWSIEPSELLADTYWTERADNKWLIEDRRGHQIRPSQMRSSGEMQHRSAHADYDEGVVSDGQSRVSLSGDDDKVRHRRRNKLPLAGRIRRRRLPHMSRTMSATSLSSDEGRLPPDLLFGNNSGGDENIGPLERHMRNMIAQDERGELSSPELLSPDHWDSPQPRLPVSRSSIDKRLRDSRHHAAGRHPVDAHKHRRPMSAEGQIGILDHGMSSMDEFVSDSPTSPVVATLVPPMGMDLSPPEQRSSTPDRPGRASRLPIFRSRSKERNQVEQTDFAESSAPAFNQSSQAKEQGTKASLEVPRPGQFVRHRTAESFANGLRRLNTASTNPASEVSSKDSGNRFFKGGRIGELVRNESSRLGDRFRTRDRAADSIGASHASRATSDVSDTEDSGKQRNRRSYIGSTDESETSPRDSFEKDRQNQKYFISNLPIFSSANTRDKRSLDHTQPVESDPIAVQQRAQREAGRSTRFQRLAPPKINLPDDEQSLDPDSTDKSARSSESKRRWGALRLRSPSVSRNGSSVSLGAPGSIAHRDGHLPVTGLYGTVSSESKRHWSISGQPNLEPSKRITARDIARVKALILSSGVKARELVCLANTPRASPLPLVTRAFETVSKDPLNVSRKEEAIVTARMLSDHVSNTTSEFDRALAHFRNERAKALSQQLEHLQHRAGDQLTILVHETSDDADAFTVELTTKAPQDIKRVDDAVNYMFRQRRRRFRLVRRTGFKMLELMTLSILWWVWLVVVLIKTARRIVWVALVFLKWLLWL